MRKFFLIFLFLPLFHLVEKKTTFQTVIHYENHDEIFNYLSNVTEFQVLNPTIISITRSEKMDEIHFYVEYTECLSQIPAIRNYARAYYTVYHDVDGSHILISKHITCFYTKYLCLSTDSTLQITKLAKSKVAYKEEISYSCPWVLTKFCFNEIAFQRKLITSKLKEIFSNTGKLQNLFLQKIN